MKKIVEKVKKTFEHPVMFFGGIFVFGGLIIGGILWLVRHL